MEPSTTSTPFWWTAYKRSRPTLAPHDYPRGTGVASWKEVDIYGRNYARSEATVSVAFKSNFISSNYNTVYAILLFVFQLLF